MPRTVEITVPPEQRADLLSRLEGIDGLAAILVHAGAGIRPAGDLVVVRGTNQAAENVTRLSAELGLLEKGCLAITEPVGLAAGERRRQIDDDTSEASWEEMDTLLRRDANVTHNFVALMGLAGALAGVGLVQDQLYIQLGAMLVAPGFEPLVRITVGATSGLSDSARRGGYASLVGYMTLAIGAAVGGVLAAWADPATSLGDISQQHWVRYWSTFSWTGVVTAAIAGLAGGVVVNSHQTVFATGVMLALALVPSMAVFGLGSAAGDIDLAIRGLGRWGVDVICVLLASATVFAVKRRMVRRGAHA